MSLFKPKSRHHMKIKLRVRALILPLALALSACQTVPLTEPGRTAFASPESSLNGTVRIGTFHIPKDEHGARLFHFLVLAGGGNVNHVVGASIFDITDEMRYVGTLLAGGTYDFPATWFEFEARPGKRTLMLVEAFPGKIAALSESMTQHVDFIEIDTQPGSINHVVLSRYGLMRKLYLGEVQISNANRKYCEALTGKPREREKSALAYMASNGIDSNATDFARFCRTLSDLKRVVSPTAEAQKQFTELKPQLEKLRMEHYEKWKREAGKRVPYDLMRSYQTVDMQEP